MHTLKLIRFISYCLYLFLDFLTFYSQNVFFKKIITKTKLFFSLSILNHILQKIQYQNSINADGNRENFHKHGEQLKAKKVALNKVITTFSKYYIQIAFTKSCKTCEFPIS